MSGPSTTAEKARNKRVFDIPNPKGSSLREKCLKKREIFCPSYDTVYAGVPSLGPTFALTACAMICLASSRKAVVWAPVLDDVVWVLP